jgi:hypothetical protein
VEENEVNRAEFQTLAEVRIDEAKELLALVPPRSDGAYYLAGYAVECALKAAIAKLNNQFDWPEKSFVADSHTHDLAKLLRLSGLLGAFGAAGAADPTLGKNWDIIEEWDEHSRYLRWSYDDSKRLIEAIADPTHGVLPWIRMHW